MAQDTKLSVQDNIWQFSVTDPQLHKKGFTIYKVSCKTFPIKSPEILTEVVCWKRYNDFKTLYKSLVALHKALHRRDQFPEFAKPKLFGRFDETVIEERRVSALELLNFVATQPHLYKSLVFRQFLEEGRVKSDLNKKGSVMLPRPSNLDIICNEPKLDGNPPSDLVSIDTKLNAHRILKQRDTVTSLQCLKTTGNDHTVVSEHPPGNNISGSNFTELASLEGTWNYPQMADTISLDSSTGDETIDTDEDSILASSLPDTDLAFFDPVRHDSVTGDVEEGSGGMVRSNSWLLAGLNMCAEMGSEGFDDHEGDAESDSVTTPRAPESLNITSEGIMNPQTTLTNISSTSSSILERKQSDLSSSTGSSRKGSSGSSASTPRKGMDLDEFDPILRMSRGSDASKVECGKGDLDLSLEWQMRSSNLVSEVYTGSQEYTLTADTQPEKVIKNGTIVKPSSSTSSRSHSIGSDKSQDSEKIKSNKSTPKKTARNLLKRLVSSSPGSRKPRSNTEQSVSTMDLGGKEDYIYLAASQICMAQNSEANGDYEMAFAYYKSGVGILLQGVQGDTNKARRDAVRRKTAQYLMKAEDLFNKHLAAENVDERRWGADSFLSPSLDLDPSFAFIRGSVKELRNFQVLGTIDKVVLVRDKATDESFVIKSIPKTTSDAGRAPSILPTSCPYMVSLHKFYETDDSVFLLLQYASGGKLWTYIGDYLNSDRNNQANDGVELDVVKMRSESRNIYSGTKVENASRYDNMKNDQLGLKTVESLSDTVTKVNETKNYCCETVESVQLEVASEEKAEFVDSLNVMRFSTFKKEMSESCVLDQLPLCASLHENTDIHSETEKYENFEDKDILNDSELCEMLTCSHKTEALHRRFSSFSDDCVQINEGDSSVISPTTILEEDHFQSMLQEHRSNLEGFSINSFESEETQRYSSSFREKIDSIPEDQEGAESSKYLASRQISADEVFIRSRKEVLNFDVRNCIRHASTDGVFSQNEASKLMSTFSCDDIIQSSKELLKQVEKVLSETSNQVGDANNYQSSGVTETRSASPPVLKQNSDVLNDSSEEPSIYDINRSTDDDTASNGNSDKNLGSPISNQMDFLKSDQKEQTFETVANAEKINGNSEAGKDMTFDVKIESESKSRISKKGSLVNNSSSVFRQTSTPLRLSINRIDSKDMTRSASFECDLKSPTRNRARTVSDLFERLDSTKVEQIRIPESRIKKWMAQLVTAVSRLHSLGIICRDLKPSNVLLGDGGQAFLTYFCHLGHNDQNIDWEAKENLCAAPEVGSISGYDQSCDWWSIGALLYELVVGRSLIDCHPGGINSHTCLHVPSFVSSEARGLLEGLLRHNSNERLGSGMAGSEEIKAHPFFSGIDWHALEYS